MSSMDGLLESDNSLGLPQHAGQLMPSIPLAAMELGLISYLAHSLPPCAPGYMWNEESEECVPKISGRSPECKWGFVKNTRMNECRRMKYNAGPQQSGTFKKFWEKYVDKPATKAAPKAAPAPPKTTAYTDGWYSYGYQYGRNDPHW